MPERLSCVPFCRRTTKAPDFSQWVCGPHWRAVPARERMFKRRADAAYRTARETVEAIAKRISERAAANDGCVHDGEMSRWYGAEARARKASRRCGRAWERCKRHAIEAAGGIG